MLTGQNSSLADAQRRMRNTSRNAQCPCGSGKKYKQCCLSFDEDTVKSAGLPGAYDSVSQGMRSEMDGFLSWLVEGGRGRLLNSLRQKDLELLYLFTLHGMYLADMRERALQTQREAMTDPEQLEQMRALKLQELERIDRSIAAARKKKMDVEAGDTTAQGTE